MYKDMKSRYLILGLFVSLFFAGCSDWLDINHDPDALETVPTADVLLPAAQLGVANNLMGWHFGFGGGFWVQYWTQSYTASQFKTLCEYQNQDFGVAYQSLMAEPLPDLRRIKAMTEGDDNKGYYFIAEALSIFTWQIITDVWGDMPYSEALRGDEAIYHPKQDKGQDIYADLMKRIDELLKIDLSKSSINGTQDVIFEGNLSKWYQFANALKLKLMIRLSETSGYSNANVLSFIQQADLLTTSAKIPGKMWDNNMNGKRHPMRAFQGGSATYISTNVRACKTIFDYLRLNSDPRQSKLFTGTRAPFFGDFDSKKDSEGSGTSDDKQSWATIALTAFDDLMIMSAWEINFYVAEVYARAGNNDKAKEFYEAGVKASLAQHGITNYGIIQTGYAVWKESTPEVVITQEDRIEQIAMQKWVANCHYQHIEAFLERNRTKYPSVSEMDIAANRQSAWANFPTGYLTISVKGRELLGGNLPQSPQYPEVYITRNINHPEQKPNVGQKVWWNQKKGK